MILEVLTTFSHYFICKEKKTTQFKRPFILFTFTIHLVHKSCNIKSETLLG